MRAIVQSIGHRRKEEKERQYVFRPKGLKIDDRLIESRTKGHP